MPAVTWPSVSFRFLKPMIFNTAALMQEPVGPLVPCWFWGRIGFRISGAINKIHHGCYRCFSVTFCQSSQSDRSNVCQPRRVESMGTGREHCLL
ncbi:hypothetical protein ILYODFUR_004901 [Ilyodon furcidens]|uniref:Secreted protein n=1 Tax=Ilyodon furcidens TaxID=33524 RepID=A0ABV0UER4_9TELE